jgi:hypothetical protein
MDTPSQEGKIQNIRKQKTYSPQSRLRPISPFSYVGHGHEERKDTE